MPNGVEINKRAGLHGRGLILFCGFMLAISAFSVDVMLPAFLPMAAEFKAPISSVQATIPAFMIFYAVAQIVYGPASDRFGRQPILAIGMVIFLVGAVVAALGATIEQVLVGRSIQGFGAAAGPVLARAILRDTHTGTALAQAMAMSAVIFSVGPIFAPLVGYGIEAAFGWRFIFVSMGLLSTTILAVNLFLFRETNSNLDPHAMQPQFMLRAFKQVLENFQSRRFLILATAAYCTLLSFIANAPRIYKTSFNVDEFQFAILFCMTGFGIIVGQIANRRLLPVLGILKVQQIASFIILAAFSITTALATTNVLSSVAFTALMFIFNTSFLVVISNSVTLIVDPHPKIAGLVSAFFGFTTATVSAVFVLLTFDLFGGDAARWGVGMMLASGLTFAGFMLTDRTQIVFQEN